MIKKYYAATLLKKSSVILIGLASSSLLARYLGPEARGTYALIVTWSAVLVVLFNFGLNYSYQHDRAQNGRGGAVFFSKAAFFISFALIFIYISAGLLGSFSNIKTLAFLVASLSLLRMQFAFIALLEKFFFASFVNVAQSVVEVSLLLWAYFYFDSDPIFAVSILLCKEVVGIALNYLIVAKAIKSERAEKIKRRVKVNFSQSKENYFFTVLNIFFLKAVILLYSFFGGGAAEIGILAVAILLSEYFWFISDISKDVLTKVSSDGTGIETILRSTRFTIFLCLTCYVVYAIMGKWIIKVLYGTSFIEVFPLSLVLLIGVIGLIPYKLLSVHNISSGTISDSNKASLIGCVLAFPLGMWVMIEYGLFGAAASGCILYTMIGLFVSLKFCTKNGVKMRDIYFIKKADLEFFKR